MTDTNILQSLHSRLLGLTKNNHLVGENHMLVPGWRDRGTRAVVLDHFLGASLDTTKWTGRVGSDGAAVTPTISVAKSGVVRLTTGAGAGVTMAVNGSQITGSLNFEADQEALNSLVEMQAALRMAAITTICTFVGFQNQTAALSMPGTIAGGVLTGNQNDFVGFLFDTAATAATWKFVSAKGGVVNGIIDTGIAPVAATMNHLNIDIDQNGNAYGYMAAALVATQANAVTKSVPLAPTVASFRRSAVSTTVDVDHIYAAQDKTA